MKVQVLILCVALLAVQANAFWIWDPESTAEETPVEVTENVEPEMAEAEEETDGLFDWISNWWNENIPVQTDTEQARSLVEKGRDMVDQGHRMIVDGINSFLPEDMTVPEAEIPTMAEINADIQAKLDELRTDVETKMAKFRETMENFDWDVLDIMPESEPEPVPEETPESGTEVIVEEGSSSKGWFGWFD